MSILANRIVLKSLIGNLVIGGCFCLSLLDLLPISLLSVSLLLGCLTASARIVEERKFML